MRRCIAQGQTRRLRALLAALDPLLVCDSAAGSRGALLCPICHELLHPDTSNAQLYSGVGGDVYFISFQAAAHGSRVVVQHRDYVKAVCYSRGLRSFVSVGLDRRMILWDLQSLQEVRCTMYEGHAEVRHPPSLRHRLSLSLPCAPVPFTFPILSPSHVPALAPDLATFLAPASPLPLPLPLPRPRLFLPFVGECMPIPLAHTHTTPLPESPPTASAVE